MLPSASVLTATGLLMPGAVITPTMFAQLTTELSSCLAARAAPPPHNTVITSARAFFIPVLPSFELPAFGSSGALAAPRCRTVADLRHLQPKSAVSRSEVRIRKGADHKRDAQVPERSSFCDVCN